MIWGCLIGLPAYLLAQLSQETSFFTELLGQGVASEEVAGALCLSMASCACSSSSRAAPTVVNVVDPAQARNRVRASLSVPVLFLHKRSK